MIDDQEKIKPRPIVSILIPYYNESGKIISTIESLKKQTLRNIEIVCIDDGSTDSTLAELNALALNDNRIKVYSKQNEGTPAKAINWGIQRISGDYFFYSSKDDKFDPDFFEKLHRRAVEVDADAVVPHLIFDFGDGDISKGIYGLKGDVSKVITGKMAAQYCLNSFEIPGNAMFKSNIVKDIGCLSFSYNSDEYTAKLYFLASNNVAFSDARFYYNQTDCNAYTKQWSTRMITGLDTNRKYEELAINNDFGSAMIHKIIRDRISLFYELFFKFYHVRKSIGSEQYNLDLSLFYKEYKCVRLDCVRLAKEGDLKYYKSYICICGFGLLIYWLKICRL